MSELSHGRRGHAQLRGHAELMSVGTNTALVRLHNPVALLLLLLLLLLPVASSKKHHSIKIEDLASEGLGEKREDAIAAAGEVLDEKMAARAEWTQLPESDTTQPSSSPLEAYIEELQEWGSACSACNLVSQIFDAKPLKIEFSNSWKDWSSDERHRQLKRVLKRRCPALKAVDIAKTGAAGFTAPGTVRAFTDLEELRSKGFTGGFDGMVSGDPEINMQVVKLCELMVDEKMPAFVARLEEWLAAKPTRKPIGVRFDDYLKVCAGGVVSVCVDSKAETARKFRATNKMPPGTTFQPYRGDLPGHSVPHEQRHFETREQTREL